MSSFKVEQKQIERIAILTTRLYNNDSCLRYKYPNLSNILCYIYDLTKLNYASVNYQYNDKSDRREELKPIDESLDMILTNTTNNRMYRSELNRYDLISLNNLLRGLNYQIELNFNDNILKDLYDSILRNLCYILTDDVPETIKDFDRWI